jgi:hypothetical protein
MIINKIYNVWGKNNKNGSKIYRISKNNYPVDLANEFIEKLSQSIVLVRDIVFTITITRMMDNII